MKGFTRLAITIFITLLLIVSSIPKPVTADTNLTGMITTPKAGSTRDIILIVDTSVAMAYETYPGGNSAIPDHPSEDPSVCNVTHTCQPFESVKTALADFVEVLSFPNDRISIVALTSQTASGTRVPVVVLPLNSDKATILNAIENLRVFQPPVCSWGSPASPANGPCINYSNSVFTGYDCPVFRLGNDLIPSTGDEVFNISSCNTNNLGGVFRLSDSELGTQRQNAKPIVIALSSGPANSTDSFPGFPDGYCPSYTWNSVTHPFCRDAYASTRHSIGHADYDADDYARDMADYLTEPFSGVGATVFTIGLGSFIRNASKGDALAGELLLKYIAEQAGGENANHGKYYYAPNTSSLASIFDDIANNSLCTSVVAVTNTLDSGAGSLRQAIIDVCDEGTITFTPALAGQTIYLQSEFVINKNLTIDGSNLDPSIKISGDSNNDGDGDTDLMEITSSIVIKKMIFEKGGAIRNSGILLIENCEFTNNIASNNNQGGAIMNNLGATATVKNSSFTENSGAGGAIGNSGTLTIENSLFSNNSSTLGGGAIVNVFTGTTKVYDSTFTQNSTQGNGGAIYNLEGVVEIYRSTFSNNSANQGGAIIAGTVQYGNNTTTLISESVISNNQASLGGGGVEFDSGTSMTIDKTTISGNTAQAGGGIANISGSLLTITNSTIANNTATQSPQPGGIISLYSPVTIKNSTITGNNHTAVGIQGNVIISNTTIAGNPGYGLEVFNFTLSITNSIIANNNFDCRTQNGATVNVNQNNLIETNNGCGIAATTSDPLLGPIADNGGLTQTMALLSGSPAIDAGTNIDCPATDQRGNSRPKGTSCDIGAFEYSSLSVNSSFGDVPMSHPYWQDIEILYANGFTGGCSASPLLFCPETTMDRAQGAVFMLRGLVGTSYVPPVEPFANPFGDSWSPGPWAQRWAQGMLDEGLTAGCSSSPLLYCPFEQMPRAQAAVFGMRLLNGSAYLPPAGTGTVFADINGSEWYAGWAEQAYLNNLLPACGTQSGRPLFCPNDLVSRGLGAYMIVRARNLSMP